MTKKLVSSLIILMLAVLLCCGLVFAASPEFSADMVMTDAKGKTTTGRATRRDMKVRQDSSPVMTCRTILRLDKKVSWTLCRRINGNRLQL